jgi:hypothetical protein
MASYELKLPTLAKREMVTVCSMIVIASTGPMPGTEFSNE